MRKHLPMIACATGPHLMSSGRERLGGAVTVLPTVER